MSQASLQFSRRLSFDNEGVPTITVPPPTSTRGHVRSKTAVNLSSTISRSQSVSPTRSSVFFSTRSSRPVSPERAGSVAAASEPPIVDSSAKFKVGKLASWFEGSSDPVNISIIPSSARQSPPAFYQLEGMSSCVVSSQDKFTQRPASKRMTTSPSTANSSMFSFFKKSTPQVVTKTDPDELADLNVTEALLSDGQINEFTPEAFEALRQNAEALLKRFQSAHIENLSALRQIRSEKNVQTDELEACQTRNEHLKMQLLEMAEKAAEQERSMAEMRDQLHKHQQSIRMITDDDPLETHHYRRHRQSDCSFSDHSITDSEMSSAPSVFSEVESIRSPSVSAFASPVMKSSVMRSPTFTLSRTRQAEVPAVLVPQCSNCHGVRASEAWDVIGIMRMESQGLKKRVAELEDAQDAALDFLSGLKL